MEIDEIRSLLGVLQEEVDNALKLLDVQLPQNVVAFQRSLGGILQTDRELQRQVDGLVRGVNRVIEEKALTEELSSATQTAKSYAAQAFALSLELDQIMASPPLFEGSEGTKPIHSTTLRTSWTPAPPSSLGPIPYSSRRPQQPPFSATEVKVKSLLQLAQRLGSQSQPPVSDPLAQSASGRGMIGDALNSLASPFSDEVFPLLGASGLRLSRLHCSLQLLLMAAQQKAAGEFGFLSSEELLAGSTMPKTQIQQQQQQQNQLDPLQLQESLSPEEVDRPFEADDLEWDDE